MRITVVVGSAWIVLAAANAAAQPDVMFVTSAKGTGKLSTWPQADGLTGLAAGNRICQNLAAAAHLVNAASFQAWLSDATTDAACNIKARSGHPPTCGSITLNNPGPWARMDGQPFARNVASLTAGEVLNAPRFDENGSVVPSSEGVWTGTGADGKLALLGWDCADPGSIAWNDAQGSSTGAVGNAQYGPVGWTAPSGSSCNQLLHLYCFQHSLFGGPPFPPFESEGALAFHTSTTYTGDLASSPDAGGQESLAAGDAICQARARAGNLPNPASFRAWLSVVAVDAIDHLDYDGPFKRPDGIQIASSKADLTDGEISSPIAETERLSYNDAFTRTGTANDGAFDDRNCFDFTQSDFSVHGVVGRSGAVEGWSSFVPLGCSSAQPIYCFSDQPILFSSGFEEGDGGLWRWSGVGSS